MEFSRSIDSKFVRTLDDFGLLAPIILFKDVDGTLTLISGDRRLKAWQSGRHANTPIPTIICTTFDELFQACLDEAEEDRRLNRAVPMLPSEKTQYGMIFRGIQVYMRNNFRTSGSVTPGCTIRFDEVAKILDLAFAEWKVLRLLTSAYVIYDNRNTSHDPELARQLLAEIDEGLITVFTAKGKYALRPGRTPGRIPSTVSPKPHLYWAQHAPSIIDSLGYQSDLLWDFRIVPEQIPSEDLQSAIATLRRVETQIGTFIRYANTIIKQKEANHAD